MDAETAENGEGPGFTNQVLPTKFYQRSFTNQEWPVSAFLFSLVDPFHDLDLQNVQWKRALIEYGVVESPQFEFGT